MRLVSLEINGFKSFATKTVVNFNQNITGVVGPNGCGKSNIVDAIRWVLGEQKSKELRSDKMSNVIFNGTKKRKAGGRAEVSLTFENTKNVLPTEYNMVTITRLLYRSGESEYRLNSVPCRLKDITSLFLDTGIGSNSYAIIALGMVDDLLADREHSRRRLFEQAAGISKYKKRKRETLNKLKGTEADLERVEDLLFEIDNNLKSLEKQAKRTKRYFQLKEDYKTLGVELAVHNLAAFKSSYKTLKTQIEEQESKKLELESDIRVKEAYLEKEKSANLDKEKSLSDRQKELNQLVGKIRGNENDKKVLQQKIQFLQQNQQSLFRQLENAQALIQQAEKDIIYYRGEINKEKDTEEQLEEVLNLAEAKLKEIRESHGTVKTELEEFISTQQEHSKTIFDLEKQKAVFLNQKESLKLQIENANREIDTRQKELNQLRARLESQIQRQQQKETLIHRLQEEEALRQKKLDMELQDLEIVKQDIVNLNRKLDAKRNEFKLLKSLVDNLEGFPESIKFLSKSSNWKKQAPLLSDVIYCKEEYRVCVENYLENLLNYYVVENIDEAAYAISLLSKSQKGKANFFLMDQIEAAQQPLAMRPSLNAVPALDVVEAEPKFQALLDHLLGKVWISDTEDPVEGAGPDQNVTLLARTGKFVRRPFSLSGGSVGLFEGKRIGRKKNLELLSQTIADLEQQGKKLSTKFDQHNREINTLKNKDQRTQIQKEQADLNRMQKDSVSLSTKQENFQTFIDNIGQRSQAAMEKIQSIESEETSVIERLKVASSQESKLKIQIKEMDQSYQSIAESMSSASSDYNQKNIEFIRHQNKISALQKELSFREKQLSDLRNKMLEDQMNRESAEVELTETQQQILDLEKELTGLYEQKRGFEGSLNDAEQSYYASKNELLKIEDEIRKTQRNSNELQNLISQLKDKFSEVKIALSSISERLRVEFSIEANDLINREPDPQYQKSDLEDKVGRLRKRLENYGEINPMAVEAYDEMKERYDFISSQREDLIEAKSSLLDTIKEIEDTATNQFLEAFDQVRDNFKRVFRSLFTEDDDCDLQLSDPENPLDSTILISAKPKGKRPQTINQLSGGEKTLTATALLFSLYLLKPAPFCIFDEVDAPLDDANIGKFNKIIKTFSQDSQFIIVTHNKQTMAAVDVIYGVTMPEQGVSQVVPVDFRSLN
ncbi:MAG: chromosome segregation protein SMC [Bacteroidota bacterium]